MAQNGVLKPSLTLQMAAGYSAYIPKLYATQTDNESIDVSVKLMDKTVPYIVPEGYQVNLRAKKPDGTVVFNALAKNGGFYVLKLGGQLTTAVGVVDAAVEVVKGSFVLNSAHFEIEVKPRTVNDGDIASEDDLTALNEYVTRSESAAESAETAADRAETAADQADQAVQSIGTATEDVKKAADSAALSASSAAQSAMEAGQSKTDAGKSAENAAASATAAAQSAAAASQSEKAAGQAAGSASQSALAASNSAQTASDKAGETKTSAQDASDAAQAASSAQTAAESAKTAAETAKGQAETQAGNAAQSAQEASASASAAAESAAQAAASAEQADLAIKTAIKLTKTGELISITDSIEYPFVGLTIYGKSTQDGTPSPENPVPIVNAGEGGSVEVVVSGAQLLPTQEVETYYINSNGSLAGKSEGNFSKIMPAIKGATYYVRRTSAGAKFRLATVSSIPIGPNGISTADHSINDNAAELSITASINGYLVINLESEEAFDGLMVSYNGYMIYSPHQSQSLIISTPNGLPGVPVDSGGNYTDSTGQQWVCDEVDLDKGVYVQRIKQFIMNQYTYIQKENKGYGFSVGENLGGMANSLIIQNRVTEVFGYCYIQSSGWIVVYDPDFSNWGTPEAFKEWFIDNCELFVALPTPIETPLSEDELAAYRALHLYHPNTNVFGTDNVGLKAQYVADTELFVNNLLADIASLHAVQDAGLGL